MKKQWKLVKRKPIHTNFVQLYEETIKLPSGETTTYIVHRGTDAGAVLLTINHDHVLTNYEYRYPVNSWIYGLPGGKIDEEESVEEAVRRECLEETGYELGKLRKLIHYHPMPSRSSATLHIFFAADGKKVSDPINSPTEKVQTRIMKKTELAKMIQQNAIVDPGLVIAWHTARLYKLL